MTGHYPSHRSLTSKGGPVWTTVCSCGWSSPAVGHAHSCSQFDTHVAAHRHQTERNAA